MLMLMSVSPIPIRILIPIPIRQGVDDDLILIAPLIPLLVYYP